MIHYEVSLAELEAAVNAVKPTWLTRAQATLVKHRKALEYKEESPSWREIVEVYMQIQHEKCAYCERRLGDKSYGKKSHEVEHYRPKNGLKKWPTDTMRTERGLSYKFSTGDETAKGYYRLSHDIRNYATACTSCNSSLKSNYFPIAGKRMLEEEDFTALRQEKPYLLFPLGDIDEDRPEDVITFKGILPVPKVTRGAKYRRAQVTIDFFDLATRDDLTRERAGVILAIWNAYRMLANETATEEDADDAQALIEYSISPESPHANCARAFYALCRQNLTEARVCKDQAKAIATKRKS